MSWVRDVSGLKCLYTVYSVEQCRAVRLELLSKPVCISIFVATSAIFRISERVLLKSHSSSLVVCFQVLARVAFYSVLLAKFSRVTNMSCVVK